MNIKEIGEFILELYKTGYGLLIPVALTALAMSRIKTIVEFFDHLSMRRLTFIKEASALEALDGPTRKLLTQELNKIVYQRVTQIRTDALMRNRIDEIIEASKGELAIAQFTNAVGHLQTIDQNLVVQITTIDKAESRFSQCLAMFIFFCAFVVMMLPIFVLKVNTLQMLTIVSVGLVMFLSAVPVISPYLRYTAAVRLKPVLARLQK
jgi:hypothetical protein